MALNHVQKGDVITWTNATGSAVESGDVVLVGGIVAVALVDIAAGASGSVAISEVWELPKNTSLAIAAGDALYWDVADEEINKTSADNYYAGVAVAAAGSTDTTVKIKLGAERQQTAVNMAPGAGFAGTGTVHKSSVVKNGELYKTTILLDLTGAASSTTDLDIIGTSGVSHIGQITAVKNGTIVGGQVTCLELPAGGADDIDLYSAVEGTGEFDGGIAALDETALIASGGAWAAGTTKGMTALPAADEYLYLTGGEAGTAATYTAGKFLIELWGM